MLSTNGRKHLQLPTARNANAIIALYGTPRAKRRVAQCVERLGQRGKTTRRDRLSRARAEQENVDYWIEAANLQAGNHLLGLGNDWITVEKVFATGEFETVCNLRIAEWHTYFVGLPD